MNPRHSSTGAGPALRPLSREALAACGEIGRAFDAARDVILTTHVNPDGDGLGAEAALASYLLGRGIRTRILNADPPPARFAFLATEEAPLGVFDPADATAVAGVDTLVILDTGATARIGAVTFPGALRVCIDHHERRETPGHVNLIDPDASSTAELLYRVLRELGAELTPAIAVPLYVGLAFDTGFFRYSNTTSDAHLVAANLCALGVRPDELYERMFATHSPGRMRLWGHALSGLALEADGRLAWMAVDHGVLALAGATAEDLEGLVEQGRQVEGVEIAMLFREDGPGRTKVSFRSNGAADVNVLAGRFGGGGHVNAAGATLALRMGEAVARVLGEARLALALGSGLAVSERRATDRDAATDTP